MGGGGGVMNHVWIRNKKNHLLRTHLQRTLTGIPSTGMLPGRNDNGQKIGKIVSYGRITHRVFCIRVRRVTKAWGFPAPVVREWSKNCAEITVREEKLFASSLQPRLTHKNRHKRIKKATFFFV